MDIDSSTRHISVGSLPSGVEICMSRAYTHTHTHKWLYLRYDTYSSGKFEIGQIARRHWTKQISPISNRRRIRVAPQLLSIQISAPARCDHINSRHKYARMCVRASVYMWAREKGSNLFRAYRISRHTDLCMIFRCYKYWKYCKIDYLYRFVCTSNTEVKAACGALEGPLLADSEDRRFRVRI